MILLCFSQRAIFWALRSQTPVAAWSGTANIFNPLPGILPILIIPSQKHIAIRRISSVQLRLINNDLVSIERLDRFAPHHVMVLSTWSFHLLQEVIHAAVLNIYQTAQVRIVVDGPVSQLALVDVVSRGNYD